MLTIRLGSLRSWRRLIDVLDIVHCVRKLQSLSFTILEHPSHYEAHVEGPCLELVVLEKTIPAEKFTITTAEHIRSYVIEHFIASAALLAAKRCGFDWAIFVRRWGLRIRCSRYAVRVVLNSFGMKQVLSFSPRLPPSRRGHLLPFSYPPASTEVGFFYRSNTPTVSRSRYSHSESQYCESKTVGTYLMRGVGRVRCGPRSRLSQVSRSGKERPLLVKMGRLRAPNEVEMMGVKLDGINE